MILSCGVGAGFVTNPALRLRNNNGGNYMNLALLPLWAFDRGLGPKVLWFAGGGGGGETEKPEESRDVKAATSALDRLSDRLSPEMKGRGKDYRSSFDDRLRDKPGSQLKLWSDAKRVLTEKIKDDKTLATKVDAVFNQDLRSKLKEWGKMVEKGHPDRDTFFKADETIADIISSYDRQLGDLAEGVDPQPSGAITLLREALRAIAASMSYTTKNLEKNSLWKN